jgi:hypothetical protein
MKKLLMIIALYATTQSIHSATWNHVNYKIMQVGETFTLHMESNTNSLDDLKNLSPAIAYEVSNWNSWNGVCSYTLSMLAAYPGTGIILKDHGETYYIIRVVEVEEVDIPDYVEISVGESYLFTPVTVPYNATTTFRWGSTNLSVASATVEGNNYRITGLEPGYTQIYCSAVTNDNSTQSVVRVKPLLVQEVSLNENENEMSIGDNLQLEATVLPENATSKIVKWISTNENIAQVDSNGKVTAIGSGYCSIYCIADDSSRKFDKCLIHVQGPATSRADVNGDGKVSVTDAFTVIDEILNNK